MSCTAAQGSVVERMCVDTSACAYVGSYVGCRCIHIHVCMYVCMYVFTYRHDTYTYIGIYIHLQNPFGENYAAARKRPGFVAVFRFSTAECLS